MKMLANIMFILSVVSVVMFWGGILVAVWWDFAFGCKVFITGFVIYNMFKESFELVNSLKVKGSGKNARKKLEN